MKNITITLFLSIIISCSSSSKKIDTSTISENNELYIVNIDDTAIEDYIYLSSFFKDVETIILETNDDCLIGEVNSLRVLDNYIIVTDRKIANSIFIFDKKGNFLHKIGQIGQGPGEYINISDSSIDFEKNEIYLLDFASDEVLKYNISSGEFIKSIYLNNSDYDNFYIQYINNKIYASAIPFSKTENSFLLQEFDVNTGDVKASYLDAQRYNKGWNSLYTRPDGFFYPSEDGSAKYVQMFMDTVISITDDKLTPYLVVKSNNWIGEKDIRDLLEYRMVNNGDLSNEVLFERNISYNINEYLESNSIIYFSYANNGRSESVVLDKENKTTRRGRFIKDDIVYSGDWVLYPSFIYADSKGFYSYLKPRQIDQFLELAHTDGLSKDLDKLDMLKEIKEDSNPVIFYYLAK